MNIIVVATQPEPKWYHYLIIGLLVPIIVFVIYRIFIRYKVVKFGNNQVEIFFPVLRTRKVYPLQQINSWKEHRVKTGKNSVYKEIEIQFTESAKLSLGFQEYSEYPKVLNYLQLKVSKKRIT